MIAEAIRILRDELATYIVGHRRAGDTIADQDIVLNNVANLETENGPDLSNKIIISLVNLQEESTLKNLPNVRPNPATGSYEYDRPPAHINLFLLISSSPSNDQQDAYEISLDRLSLIIEFFQAKNYFTIANSPHSSIVQNLVNSPQGTDSALALQDLKIYIDLYSLTFEQLNHLWGSLGGKQLPAVLYKVRLVKIQRKTGMETPLVEDISANSSSNKDT